MDADRARRYARAKRIISLSDAGIQLAAAVAFVVSPASSLLAFWSAGQAGEGYLQWLLFFGVMGAGSLILGLPAAFLAGYTVEHRFGLSTQSFKSWLGEQGKGLALSVVFGVPLVMGFRWVLLAAGGYWGLTAGAAIFLFSVVLAGLAPTLIMPLFYKFRRIERPEIMAALLPVCERAGMKLDGVYQFDMSKNTRKANAAFTGIGRTKRVVLGDTLLDAFTLDEIRAVVAHEAGHYRHAHLLKGLAFNGASLVVLFGAAQWGYGLLADLLGYGSAGDLAGVPLILLLLGIAGFLFQPLSNGLSRRFEWQADRYAFAEGDAVPLAAALSRLGTLNLAEQQPPAFVEFWFHSHPAVGKRIAAAQAYQAR